MLKRNSGQSIVEYAILLGVIIAALLIMQAFIKRGYQGGLKDAADKMGDQYSVGSSTVYQKREMTGTQTIAEETASDATITAFASNARGDLIDQGVYSSSERTGGQQVSETQAKTDASAGEETRASEYQNTDVGDFSSDNLDF